MEEISKKLDKIHNMETRLNIEEPDVNWLDRGLEKSSIRKPHLSIKSSIRRVGPSIQKSLHKEMDMVRDELRNPYWIEQDNHIGSGPQRFLKAKEIKFWIKLIDTYLKPLDKDIEKEKKDTQGLKDLRNMAVFSFLMFNSMWVMLFYVMQANKDSLSIANLSPVALLVVGWMFLVYIFQFGGMLQHRLSTLGHIVSTTKIGLLKVRIL